MGSVLVTGGAGYIGSHLCSVLLSTGHRVGIFDNFSSGEQLSVERLQELSGRTAAVVEGDVRDFEALSQAVGDFAPDVVIHLAGLKSVRESVDYPHRYYEVNVSGGINVLRAMQAHGVSRLVFSSSATVYSAESESPLSEGAAISPYNPYGESKYVMERLMFQAAQAQPGLSMLVLRYFNPVGAHPSGLLGESMSGSTGNLSPAILKALTGKSEGIDIYGDDWSTRDGTGERDYVHVMDLAEGHASAVDWCMRNTGWECVNLGGGRGYTVLEMISAFERVSGLELNRLVRPRRAGDIGAYYADVSKASRVLSWHPRLSLDVMARDAWNWCLIGDKSRGRCE